eukprot:3854532-Prymnesium_polylepis.1
MRPRSRPGSRSATPIPSLLQRMDEVRRAPRARVWLHTTAHHMFGLSRRACCSRAPAGGDHTAHAGDVPAAPTHAPLGAARGARRHGRPGAARERARLGRPTRAGRGAQGRDGRPDAACASDARGAGADAVPSAGLPLVARRAPRQRARARPA